MNNREGGGRGPDIPTPEIKNESPELTQERLKELSTLNIEVATDLAPVLNALNDELGVQMKARDGGQHITVFGPGEKKHLDGADPSTLDRLQTIARDIREGKGVKVSGVGFIDGAASNVAKKDSDKKASFIAVEIEALNELRESLGLPRKDFHITLGFVNGDIHMELTGEKDEKGKDAVRPIAKKADPKFDALLQSVPDIELGGLSGTKKEKRKEKKANPEAEAKKRLKKIFAEEGLSGKDLISLGFSPGPELGKILAAVEKAVREGGELQIDASDEVREKLAQRIDSSRKKMLETK